MSGEALLLDEMFAPVIAATLRARDHDVVTVVEDHTLRTLSDARIFAWAAHARRRIVTENVQDFRPLLHRALSTDEPAAALLFTSTRTFQRTRKNPGPLIDALDAWLRAPTAARVMEDWLTK